MISALDLELFRFVETADEAWSVLEAEYGFAQGSPSSFGDLATDI
jgi:hypothetical protein